MKLFSLVLVFTVVSQAAKWEIDPAHSSATFTVSHMTISKVTGSVSGIKGSFDVPGKDFTKAMVEATLDSATINTLNADRDKHLRSPDFLDAAKFPTIQFKAKSISKDGDKYKVVGDLTLHGVTKEVALSSATLTDAIKGPEGKERRGFSGSASLDRKDFGMVFNKVLDNGGLAVGNTLDIQINLELVAASKS